MLKGEGEGFSNVINALRYRSAYDDTRCKEKEVEALLCRYEQAERAANQPWQDHELDRRRQQSEPYLQRQQQPSPSGRNKQEKRQSSSWSNKQRQRQGNHTH